MERNVRYLKKNDEQLLINTKKKVEKRFCKTQYELISLKNENTIKKFSSTNRRSRIILNMKEFLGSTTSYGKLQNRRK